MATSKVTRSTRGTQPSRPKKHSTKSKTKPAPGEFALQERTLPHRRFVEFPLVRGKVTEKIRLFVNEDSQSLTIEFQDHTSLYLDFQPSLTANAVMHRDVKGELEPMAEWPPIRHAR